MYRRIVPLISITCAIFSGLAFVGVHKNTPTAEPTDTVRIVISRRLRHRRFQPVNALLKELEKDKKGFFQESEFKVFFTSEKTRLVFSQRRFIPALGGQSYRAYLNKGVFEDTIYLNRGLFRKASKEYFAAVIIHESLHAYITWCCFSFDCQLNGVDSAYLKKHFPAHWEWLTSKPYVDDGREHILMSENFIGIMIKSLYLYTNPDARPLLRDSVALALTWGGLNKTPEWSRLKMDTCYLHSVDVWSRNMDADSTKGVPWQKCDTTYTKFRDSLYLVTLCK